MGRLQVRFDTLLLLTIANCVLLCIIVAASLMWVLWWMMLSEPPNKDTKYLQMLDKHIHSRFFRTDDYYGSALIYQSAVFILMALLSYVVIELRKKIQLRGGGGDGRDRLARRPRLTTYPLVVQGPFGVVTAAEVLCAAGLLFLLLYSFSRPTYVYIKNLYKLDPTTFTASLQLEKLNGASYYMGRAAMISFSLLWIPVSRGSPFLRLINVPFENAIKYHTWLSVVTLSMLTLHSIGYILYYVLSHTPKEIIGWRAEAESCSVVAGLVAWIVGLIMWATSLSFVRRRWYEVFFGVHHLYVIFFIFWLYHVMWTVHLIIIPFLLFAIDRFLRLVQSRQSVDVLSANVMESGAIELKIARNKSKGIAYHPLSSWYLQFSSLSRLMKFQWHFFSVISTGLDEKEALSIVIKPLGNWTNHLRERLLESTKQGANARCPFSFKAAVEGPYGDESNFFLRYNVIILIGGGIGVTPLLAVLQDILHRKRRGEDKLPTSIHLHHCVRKQEELCVLNSVDPNLILPQYEKQGLDIRVNAYVTSHSLQGNERKDDQKMLDLATFGGSPIRQRSNDSSDLGTSKISSPISMKTFQSTPIPGICAISSSGNSKWLFLTILASIVGFYIIWGLSNALLIKKFDAPFPNYHRAHLVVASVALGVSLFGGMIILLWWSHLNISPKKENGRTAIDLSSLPKVPEKPSSPSSIGGYQNATDISIHNHHHEQLHEDLPNDIENASSLDGSPWNGTLHLQTRPEWREIFHSLSIEYQGQNIGVLVSGPTSMQQDIAEECQRHSKLLQGASSSNIFHFHSISFNV